MRVLAIIVIAAALSVISVTAYGYKPPAIYIEVGRNLFDLVNVSLVYPHKYYVSDGGTRYNAHSWPPWNPPRIRFGYWAWLPAKRIVAIWEGMWDQSWQIVGDSGPSKERGWCWWVRLVYTPYSIEARAARIGVSEGAWAAYAVRPSLWGPFPTPRIDRYEFTAETQGPRVANTIIARLLVAHDDNVVRVMRAHRVGRQVLQPLVLCGSGNFTVIVDPVSPNTVPEVNLTITLPERPQPPRPSTPPSLVVDALARTTSTATLTPLMALLAVLAAVPLLAAAGRRRRS